MARLTPAEAVARYEAGVRPTEMIEYDQLKHREEMEDLMPGLVGACLVLDLPSLTSVEVGSRIPCFVLNVPRGMPRMYIQPSFAPIHGTKKEQRLSLTALGYLGDIRSLDTDSCYAPKETLKELLRVEKLLGGS